MLSPDLCIIGAGSAGLSVAAAAARLGRETVLIESGLMGGDCLNVGCVPSKSLLAAAKLAASIRAGGRLGVHAGEPAIDFAQVMAHVRGVIARIAPHDSVERFEGLGARVIRARARFLDARTVAAGGREIRARRFVIATGSRPAAPPIPGLDAASHLTNESVFELAELPAHLLVLGAGPVGCELAQAFRRLGSRVTLLDRGTILSRDDPELVAVLRARLLAEGVDVREGAAVVRAEPGPRLALRQGCGEAIVAGSHLLVAAGRRPETSGLDLEAAGILHDINGIKVDAGLRTSNRRAYAIGDCTGGAMFTHRAGHEAGLVVRSALFRLPVDAQAAAIPRVTYTEPELAQVGLDEAAARQKNLAFEVVRTGFAENDRARAEGEDEGLLKLVVGKDGRPLGCGIVGPLAGELVTPWVLAIERRLKLSRLAGLVVPYPTLSEIGRQAAGTYYAPRLFAPSTRRLVDLLARFG